jgi:hypothetical protein
MPETKPEIVTYSYKELAEILVKHQGIREGHWSIYISGANAGPTEADIVPAAIVPVSKCGLQRIEKPNALSVDASKVNPAGKKPKK